MQKVLEPLEIVLCLHPTESFSGSFFELDFRPTKAGPVTGAVKIPADIFKRINSGGGRKWQRE
jgi:hypothetical protein